MPGIVLGLRNISVLKIEKVCVINSHICASDPDFALELQIYTWTSCLSSLLGCLVRMLNFMNTKLDL